MGDKEMTVSELAAMIFYFGSIAAAFYVTLWLAGVPL